jgi:hypothetical protein
MLCGVTVLVQCWCSVGVVLLQCCCSFVAVVLQLALVLLQCCSSGLPREQGVGGHRGHAVDTAVRGERCYDSAHSDTVVSPCFCTAFEIFVVWVCGR